ncbi:bifunctional diaminohydroxyphosphoribosylaminopyrimidine deaminase/5-amino-6-(5-phosphoribosylamino)uracil reductase RibD [Winogradskyella sp. 3972H.M.0a.05]|uniref:bifunctional diaminohydroxyphosphoribosylaminopyrimidine deaminase/5-amino-6-(5-phosphoribosylamino)uracil reductase RibD n=1 Tax=Winogradskyella sp. 3972H.M.0a.05 TaxID=2950277 RepID=UPI0033968684
MKSYDYYIKRCIAIAKKGLGTTRPNPMVGCVIVHDDKIIGEGYTSPYGGPHAEVNAINSVEDKSLLKASTLYVTLEPCSHHGKTPPCSDLIIKNQIPRVVIGSVDDNEEVAGRGIERLKNAGCEVVVGVLENECRMHHKRFFTFHNKRRPYIILKWAQTMDGFIAPRTKASKQPVWITNKPSRQLVHKWRSEEHAILVGANTVLEDNPSLTVRDWTGLNPVRVVLDKDNSLSKSYNIFNSEAETLVISNNTIDFIKPLAEQVCKYLYQENIQSVIIEGGAKTLQTFINENLWDEARVFYGPVNFEEGIHAPMLSSEPTGEHLIKGDVLKIYKND